MAISHVDPSAGLPFFVNVYPPVGLTSHPGGKCGIIGFGVTGGPRNRGGFGSTTGVGGCVTMGELVEVIVVFIEGKLNISSVDDVAPYAL